MSTPILNSIFSYLQGDGAVILPEMQLTLFGLGILLIGFSVDESMENNWFWRLFFKDFSAKAAFAGVLFSGLSLWKLRGRVAGSGTLAGFHESVVVDGFLIFFAALFLVSTALVILLSVKYLEIEREQEGEYYALLLFACVGMMLMASGVDLIVMFLGLETMALSFYVLTGFLRRDEHRHHHRGTGAARQIGARRCAQPSPWRAGRADAAAVAEESTHSTELRSLRSAASSDPRIRSGCGRIVFQSRGCAVSSVGAGCLRRRANADCRLCQRGFQDGEFRFASAAFPLRLFSFAKGFARTMDVPHRGSGRGVAYLGQPRRANADQREAPPGILLDLARGLHSARPRCRKRDRFDRNLILPVRVRVHDRGSICGHYRSSPERAHRRGTRGPERLVPAQPRLGVAASDLHAFACGHTAHGRFHGQVFHFPFADRNAPSGARRFRCVVYRSRALLLLPHCRARLAQAAGRSAASVDDERAGCGPRRRRVCHTGSGD